MLLVRPGEKLEINGRIFEIGNFVIAKNSKYKYLIGSVIEIRTDENKDTENPGPDIYVNFNEDIVIMAGEMLEIL